jgi:hypothetical protein
MSNMQPAVYQLDTRVTTTNQFIAIPCACRSQTRKLAYEAWIGTADALEEERTGDRNPLCAVSLERAYTLPRRWSSGDAKLNNVNPGAYIRHVLERIVDIRSIASKTCFPGTSPRSSPSWRKLPETNPDLAFGQEGLHRMLTFESAARGYFRSVRVRGSMHVSMI